MRRQLTMLPPIRGQVEALSHPDQHPLLRPVYEEVQEQAATEQQGSHRQKVEPEPLHAVHPEPLGIPALRKQISGKGKERQPAEKFRESDQGKLSDGPEQHDEQQYTHGHHGGGPLRLRRTGINGALLTSIRPRWLDPPSCLFTFIHSCASSAGHRAPYRSCFTCFRAAAPDSHP